MSPVRQIAYFVPDARAAALAHAADFGSGPFFLAEHIPLSLSRHRGVDRPLDHSSAYGQWGPVMIEFVQQNNAGPSVFRDRFPGPADQGLHHLAVFVPSVPAAVAEHEAAGREAALYAEMIDGFPFAMIDLVASHGHYLELYEPRPGLLKFYKMVADAARDWDGADPVRTIRL